MLLLDHTIPWLPFQNPNNPGALLLLYCVALTLVTALLLNTEAPPRDLTQKVPALKAVGGHNLSLSTA